MAVLCVILCVTIALSAVACIAYFLIRVVIGLCGDIDNVPADDRHLGLPEDPNERL